MLCSGSGVRTARGDVTGGTALTEGELLERVPAPAELHQLVELDTAQRACGTALGGVHAPRRHAHLLRQQTRSNALLGVREGLEHVHERHLGPGVLPGASPILTFADAGSSA